MSDEPGNKDILEAIIELTCQIGLLKAENTDISRQLKRMNSNYEYNNMPAGRGRSRY